MARPTKLTRERLRAVYETLRAGGSNAAAAASAGVDMSTLTRWRQRGQAARSGLYRELFEAMESALSAGEAVAARAIIGAFTQSTKETIVTVKPNGERIEKVIERPPDARMALEWLARRSAKHWNLKALIAVAGDPDGAPIRLAGESVPGQAWEELLGYATVVELRALGEFRRVLAARAEARAHGVSDTESVLLIAGEGSQ